MKSRRQLTGGAQEWSRTIWVDSIGGCHGLHYQLNGQTRSVDVDGDTPLLWVLRDVLGMTGTKFGSHYHFAETNSALAFDRQAVLVSPGHSGGNGCALRTGPVP